MLNENLSKVRKERGLTQEALAVKLNVVRQTISKWENDNRYRLVTDIAKCARKISEKAENDGEILIEKPVSIAIDKLANDKNIG